MSKRWLYLNFGFRFFYFFNTIGVLYLVVCDALILVTSVKTSVHYGERRDKSRDLKL